MTAQHRDVGRLGYVPALDGIRAIAIAAVVCFHYFHRPVGGFIGVDLFFVLSGFLITTLLLEEHAENGTVSLRDFYERRIRRLLPAAWTVLAVIALLMGYTVGAITGLVYVANIYDAVNPPQGGPTAILWSLSMEEQFYLLWPLALLFLLRRKLRLARVLIAAAVAFALYRLGWLLAGANDARVYYAPDTHADPLIIGCLLAVLRRAGRWSHSRLVIIAALALLGLVLAVFRVEAFASQSIAMALTELAGVGLIIAAVNGSWLLGLAPLVWLGRISYSLYLWHPVAAHAIPSTWIALPVALLLAWLSYRYVETRFRHHRGPQHEPSATPAAATAAP